MGFLKEIVVFLQNRPPSAGGPLKCVDFFSQNRILAHLSVCPLKCVGTVLRGLGQKLDQKRDDFKLLGGSENGHLLERHSGKY